ncbi:MAG: hypothetical protein CMM60_11860 [Rhodospirillaceae bacterium]|jgi:hypothetical protein|nr:hypothetical protein [Rhodospirillaceae bacterium]|tara:strand:- start:2402 stop:2836 length:435 start_codon:yes stop_codon:yes gene_type:complete
MADENDIPGALEDEIVHAPAKPRAPARVDPDMVKEFKQEIDAKVAIGHKRMRGLANHLTFFVAAIAAVIPLRLTVFEEYHEAFFLVPLAAWVGLLAFHANYALRPILRRSGKESRIKAVIQPVRNRRVRRRRLQPGISPAPATT